jgi:predicted PurR-regulated permease PerM
VPRRGGGPSDSEPPEGEDEAAGGPQLVQLDPEQLTELSRVFLAPRWLRDLGFASWLLTGVAALLFGLVWLAGQASTIIQPVLVGMILATVAAPTVSRLTRRGIPRAAGAAIMLLALIAIAVVILLLVLGGIAAHSGEIGRSLTAGVDNLRGKVEDAGVGHAGAASAASHAERTTPTAVRTLLTGAITGIQGLASLAMEVSFAIFSLFFLLKDGPSMRRWVERHMGVPVPVARTITSAVITALQRYFVGLSIVAGFNAALVGAGAFALGVPLAGTIAVVTFVTAYVPFLGAFVAGTFAVLLALGTEGTTSAGILLVIFVLANGPLQNVVQPIAFGATLELNPLVVLVVTISAGALFGILGMIVAAPLTSAAVHIAGDLNRAAAARGRETAEPGSAPA